MNFFPLLGKKRNFDSNKLFIKNCENVSRYSKNECLQLENTKVRDQCDQKRSKVFWNFVKNPVGKIIFRAPPYLIEHTFFRQTQISGSTKVNSNHLWQLTLVRFECQLMMVQMINWTKSHVNNRVTHHPTHITSLESTASGSPRFFSLTILLASFLLDFCRSPEKFDANIRQAPTSPISLADR